MRRRRGSRADGEETREDRGEWSKKIEERWANGEKGREGKRERAREKEREREEWREKERESTRYQPRPNLRPDNERPVTHTKRTSRVGVVISKRFCRIDVPRTRCTGTI